jgi:hypothetical protein
VYEKMEVMSMETTKMDSASYLEESVMVEKITQEVPPEASVTETSYSRKIKPRALIFKATEKDLDKIKELIETQFTEVEIIYVTTGPATSILRVTKSMPFETEDSSTKPLCHLNSQS